MSDSLPTYLNLQQLYVWHVTREPSLVQSIPSDGSRPAIFSRVDDLVVYCNSRRIVFSGPKCSILEDPSRFTADLRERLAAGKIIASGRIGSRARAEIPAIQWADLVPAFALGGCATSSRVTEEWQGAVEAASLLLRAEQAVKELAANELNHIWRDLRFPSDEALAIWPAISFGGIQPVLSEPKPMPSEPKPRRSDAITRGKVNTIAMLLPELDPDHNKNRDVLARDLADHVAYKSLFMDMPSSQSIHRGRIKAKVDGLVEILKTRPPAVHPREFLKAFEKTDTWRWELTSKLELEAFTEAGLTEFI